MSFSSFFWWTDFLRQPGFLKYYLRKIWSPLASAQCHCIFLPPLNNFIHSNGRFATKVNNKYLLLQELRHELKIISSQYSIIFGIVSNFNDFIDLYNYTNIYFNDRECHDKRKMATWYSETMKTNAHRTDMKSICSPNQVHESICHTVHIKQAMEVNNFDVHLWWISSFSIFILFI